MSHLLSPWTRLLPISLLALCAARHAGAGLITNGGFESGGGSFSGWTVATAPGSGGNWYVQSGASSPVNGFPVAAPPGGAYAAMTDSSGPGAQALLQSFTIPVDAISVTLSFQYFLLNPSSQDFVVPNPATLDYTGDGNEQARVDILTSAAAAFDLGAAAVQNVFQTNSGDPNQYTGYQTLSADITSAVTPGGTYQLRFAEVDNVGAPLVFGVDNVSVAARTSDNGQGAVPEPGTLLLGVLGIVALAICADAGRRRHP